MIHEINYLFDKMSLSIKSSIKEYVQHSSDRYRVIYRVYINSKWKWPLSMHACCLTIPLINQWKKYIFHQVRQENSIVMILDCVIQGDTIALSMQLNTYGVTAYFFTAYQNTVMGYFCVMMCHIYNSSLFISKRHLINLWREWCIFLVILNVSV